MDIGQDELPFMGRVAGYESRKAQLNEQIIHHPLFIYPCDRTHSFRVQRVTAHSRNTQLRMENNFNKAALI